MGRGDRPAPPRAVLRNVDRLRRYEVVIADEATDELAELITYIKKSSPKNAAAVYDAISQRLFRLGTNPRTGHADLGAPLVAVGAAALITTVKKVALYYLFPLTRRGHEIVFVVSVRRGSRMPLEQPEYARRWLEEVAKQAPPEEAPSDDPAPG